MNTTTMERKPLTSIVGTVLQIEGAPEGKPAKVKLTDGRILRAFPDKLRSVQEGGTYDFGCEINQVGGVNYNNVRAVRAASQQQSSTPPRSQPARQAPAQAQRSAPVNQHVDPPQHHQPPPQNGNGNGYYRPTHPRDAERMWVCATLGHFIDRGAVTLDAASLIDAVNVTRQVWQATFGADRD